MRPAYFRGARLSALLIAMLLTFAALSLLVLPAPTAVGEGEALIWTEDVEGNIRTDFEQDENVHICGSGFNSSSQIDITITQPDNTTFQDSTFSDDNGGFVYIYQLDGMVGTYYVTATDGVNSASTTFDDCLRMLEGYDKAAGRWERGLLEGWKELDWVPYRIKFAKLPKGTSNFSFNVYHNNLLGDNLGVDRLINFRVGDVNGNPVDGSVTVSGPFYKTPGKSSDRDIYYSLSVTFNTPSWWLSWYVYWDAHLAIGSSGWPGAKLHAYSGITGCQTVPIKVPPIPPGSISGSKWNDLSYNGIWNPGEPGLSGWTIQLFYFDPVENSWINLDNKNTGAGGGYTFSKLVAGNYRLTEILKENWVQTYPPSPGSHSITLSEGENRVDINFGNILAVHDVEVFISPGYQSGLNGATLSYTVTVKNTGALDDNYDLTVSDNAGWGPTISPTSLTVPAGENRTATLSVTVPDNAAPCTQDNITVTATSQLDNTVRDSDSSIAHAKLVRGVDVSISPEYQDGQPGATLTYIVTAKNVGNVTDNYVLIAWDNEGWLGPWTQELIDVPPGENRTKPLNVTIPDNAVPCTKDNIIVKATSQADNMVSAENSAIAHVIAFFRKVRVSLTPTHQENLPGAALNYTVVVTNEGDVADNYALEASDNENWGPTVMPSSLAIAPGASDNATLSIVIPENTWAYKEATVVATAKSIENVEVSASDVGVAKTSVVRGVDVSISPSENEALPGENATYAVTITNTGNVEDSYVITVSDNAGWPIEFGLVWVKLAPYGSAVVWNLTVTVPENAVPGTPDNITVTAVSENDPTVRDNESCIALAAIVRGVKVSISPNWQENENGGTLTYMVTIANTGNVPDNYALENIDTMGWSLSLSQSLLENIEDGASEDVTLTVAIPADVMGCTLDNVTVIATSQENENVSNSESCLAHVRVLPGIDVRIEPSWQENFFGENLTYTVTVINIGNARDNYILTAEDNAGWGLTLSENLLNDLAPGENRIVVLTVTILESTGYFKEDDTITVIATSMENTEISDDASCIAHGISWTGWATFKLENLYKVSLEKDLQLYAGRKLVVKFYKYDITPQEESVIHNFTPRENIKENENVPHPRGVEGFPWGTVQIAKLVLTTDNTEEVISEIANFTVHQSDLRERFKTILKDWAGNPGLWDAFRLEAKDILKQWASAPP